MRFSVPRSLSPSPARRKPRHSRSTFRAPSTDSESSEDDYDHLSSGGDDSSEFDSEISAVSSSIRLSLPDSESDEDDDEDDEDENGSYVLPSSSRAFSKSRQVVLKTDKDREIEETLVSIRARIRHNDPYDVWERQTRKDAFHAARSHHTTTLSALRSSLLTNYQSSTQSLTSTRTVERADLNRRITQLEIQRQNEERRLREAWKERERRLWERVEGSIRNEGDRLKARLEKERKEIEEREEAERRRQEELKRRQEEEKEKRRREEEEREKVAKELEREMREKERLELEMQEEAEKARQSQAVNQVVQELRGATGIPTAEQAWQNGLNALKILKTSTMRAIKGPKPPDPEPAGYQAPLPPPIKKLWSAQRRKITPKIGQLTDDAREIARITEDLRMILSPDSRLPVQEQQNIHYALLSSLSKALIAQAETEVTANKLAARPLAQVAISIMKAYPDFAEIFWARLVGSVGVWAVGGASVSSVESGCESDKEKMKRWGMRTEEAVDAYVTRVTGVVRLYCEILFVNIEQGGAGAAAGGAQMSHPLFRPARYWAYLAQLINNEGMLGKPVAPEAIYVALDASGARALTIWGAQFVKLLKVVYDGVQGQEKEKWGGKEVVAQASRARCVLEVEKILSGAS